MTIDAAAVPVAHVVRGGVVESVHHGHVVGLDATGAVAVRAGDVDVTLFARSSLKPLQAVAMLRAGLSLDDDLLALACASHNGEPAHLDGTRRILAGAHLDESALQNTPDLPLVADASLAWRSAGNGPSSLTQNCSGKHAAMLATCVAAGWDLATYRSPDHPLQGAVRSVVAELTGDAVEHTTVDGCGAPLYSCTLAGLARAFARIASAPAGSVEGRVAAAMSAHPFMVGGTGRDVTDLMAGVPGLVAKDGAEGVYACCLPDGRAVALKVLDGSQRPRPVVMVAALRALGVDAPALDDVGQVPVLGHGEPVGLVEAIELVS
ncbi:MAG TPA: asparaginase [Actinomycetales bacterium]|nr:asparaginase [Actinomycetales bacterium]